MKLPENAKRSRSIIEKNDNVPALDLSKKILALYKC